MRDFQKEKEEQFFKIVSPFYNLEATPIRAYSEEEYSLNRMKPLVKLVNNPENDLKIIHIAGTKGKGTTCFFLSALLQSAGKKVGTFSSPHVATVRERFLINGQLIDYEFLLKETQWLCQELQKQPDLHPSLFELMTVLACHLFKKSGCEYVILETGIGGTLDATNYVEKPLICGLASISFDHQELLGKTIQEIASQKAGIIKPNIPVVCGIQPFLEAKEVIIKTATQLHAPLITLEKNHLPPEVDDYLPKETADFLKENFSLAWKICQTIKIVPVITQFQQPELRARFEIINQNPPVILDAAHNRNSAKRLTEAIQKRFPQQKFVIILGVVPGKDYQGIIDELQPIIQKVILTDPKTTKGSRSKEIKIYLTQKKLDFQYIPQLTKDDIPRISPILFTGSFYTAVIGEELYL